MMPEKYQTLRQLDYQIKGALKKRALLERLRFEKGYKLTAADQTLLISMHVDYNEKIEDILKIFQDQVSK